MSEKTCWKALINKTTDTLDILLHDEIGFFGDNSKDFTNLLKENKDRVLNIEINSPGGSVFDGFAIYDALKNHPAPVNIRVTGVAASIASVIAMAGEEKPIMPENSMMMIHPPFLSAGGNSTQLRERAEVLDKMQDQIITAYLRHSTATREELEAMVNKTTWMTAEEAAGFGLASFVPEKVSISNMYDFTMYNYAEIPAHVAEKYKQPEIEPEKTILDKVVDLLKNTTKKEPSGMSKEFENKIAELETANQASEAKITALASENDALKVENSTLKASIEAANAAKVTGEIKEFLDGLVKEGKLLPVNLATQSKKLEVLAKADAELFNAEKAILSAGAVLVDVSGEHFADNNSAPAPVSASKLESAVEAKIAANPGMTYRAALEAVLFENPELSEEV